MDDKTKRILYGFQSLNIAMQEAGGSIPAAKYLEETSALEFLTVLGMNGIQFKFEKPNEGV